MCAEQASSSGCPGRLLHPSESFLAQVEETFSDMSSPESVHAWMETVLFTQLYTPATAFGQADVGLLYGQNAIIGGIRIGQLRAKDVQEQCTGLSGQIPARDGGKLTLPCWGRHGKWDDALEDQSTIARNGTGITFQFHGGGTGWLPDAQVGESFYSIDEERNFYGGSGGILTDENIFFPAPAYGVVLPHPTSPNASTRALALLRTLAAGQYIGPDTRLLTIQFNLYSEPVDQFGIWTLYFEFPATGGVNAGAKNNIVRLYTLTSGRQPGDVILELIVAGFFAAFLLMEVVAVWQKGAGELLALENLMHKVNIFLYAGTWAFRMAALWSSPPKARLVWDADTYYGLQAPGALLAVAVSFSAINSFLCFFKLAHYLSQLPQFALVTGTIYRAVGPITAFMFVFGVVFVGFAIAHLLVFGQELPGFQNLRDTSYSLLLSLMGDTQLHELERVNAWWGPAFVVGFTLICAFIILNVFIAIVTEGYELVRDELTKANAAIDMNQELGWYFYDKVRALPWLGPWLDFNLRYTFSTVRLKRRLAQHALLARARMLKLMAPKGSGEHPEEGVEEDFMLGTEPEDENAVFQWCMRTVPCARRCVASCCPAHDPKAPKPWAVFERNMRSTALPQGGPLAGKPSPTSTSMAGPLAGAAFVDDATAPAHKQGGPAVKSAGAAKYESKLSPDSHGAAHDREQRRALALDEAKPGAPGGSPVSVPMASPGLATEDLSTVQEDLDSTSGDESGRA